MTNPFTPGDRRGWVTVLVNGFWTQVPAADETVTEITHVVRFVGGRTVGYGSDIAAAIAAQEEGDFTHVLYVDTETGEALYDGCAIDIVLDIP